MSVSIFCSPTELRLVVGSANNNRVKIEEFHELPLPETTMINGIITNPDSLLRYLKDVQKVRGPFGQDAVIVLESNLVRTKIMTIPKVAPRQVTLFVTDELKALADDASAAEEIYDYSIIGDNSNTGGLDVLGVAVGRPLLKPYLETFGASGFKIKKIDVGVNALIKIIDSYVPQLKADTNLFMFIDAKVLFITLFEDGGLRIIKKYRLIGEEGTLEYNQEIANHLSAMVQFQMGQHHEAGIHSIYTAGMAPERLAGLAGVVSYLNIPIEDIQLDNHLDFVGKAGFDGSEFRLSKYLLNIGGLLGK